MVDEMNTPVFFTWGGGGIKYRYSFGWWTGLDNDLICVIPIVETKEQGEVFLSPSCSSKLMAVIAFFIKRYRIRK